MQMLFAFSLAGKALTLAGHAAPGCTTASGMLMVRVGPEHSSTGPFQTHWLEQQIPCLAVCEAMWGKSALGSLVDGAGPCSRLPELTGLCLIVSGALVGRVSPYTNRLEEEFQIGTC